MSDLITLSISSLSSDGRGIARISSEDASQEALRGMTVFVEGALPGQTVSARISARHKRFAEAVVESVLIHSPHEKNAPCPHFDICGGCSWQCLPYTEQLRWKEQIVFDALSRIGRISEPPVLPIIPSPNEWGYRNKMEFVFGENEFGGIALGQYARRTHRVADISSCLMSDSVVMRAVNVARMIAQKSKLPAKTSARPDGFWRHLVVRCPREGGHFAELIVNPSHFHLDEEVLAHELCTHAGLDGVVVSSRVSDTSVAFGESTLACAGNMAPVERMRRPNSLFPDNSEVSLVCNHASFLQVNTSASELLYSEAASLIADKPVGTLWDLYCGVGSIGLFLAPLACRVYGVETGGDAVKCARNNAIRNGFSHCSYKEGDAGTAFAFMKRTGVKDDTVIVVDPPRAGLSEFVTEQIVQVQAPRLIYISCNPSTLARDIARLSQSYRLVSARPVDLFPQTPHVETVCLLVFR